MEECIHEYPPIEVINWIINNSIDSTRTYHFLWIHDKHPRITNKDQFDAFVNHRADDFIPLLKLLKGKNVEIIVANEPFYLDGWGSWWRLL